MLGLLERIKKVAACDANILIQGDCGSGNECIALLLHQESQRSQEVFLARNCTSIPAECFESEMFGHSSSFAGVTARTAVAGAFVEADKGTLFLDEIGELGYSLQSELLLAIKRKIIHPVGSDQSVRVSPRIISSTSRALHDRKHGKRFRDDLYFRVATVVLSNYPLREHRDDIIPLARHFALRASMKPRTLTLEAENRLLEHDWPGNIRELRTLVEEAVIQAADTHVHAEELNFETRTERLPAGSRLLADVERRHILNVMKNCSGNKTDAAKTLGLARSTLILKLRTISALPDTSH
jgi:DNA-binding NtrC family response regulator